MERPSEIRDELLGIIQECNVMFGILFPGKSVDPQLVVDMAMHVQLIRHIDAIAGTQPPLPEEIGN